MFDSAFEYSLGARWLFAVVTARLQRHINGGSFRRLGAGGQRGAFCMEVAVPCMVSLPDDLIVFYDHCTYQRVGAGVAGTLQGQLDGQFHIVAIGHVDILSVDMNKAPIRQDRGSCFLKVRSTLHKMLAERFAGEIRLPATCLL